MLRVHVLCPDVGTRVFLYGQCIHYIYVGMLTTILVHIPPEDYSLTFIPRSLRIAGLNRETKLVKETDASAAH